MSQATLKKRPHPVGEPRGLEMARAECIQDNRNKREDHSERTTMVTEGVVREWLDRYGHAWESQDAAAAAALFTEDGTYARGPFNEPIKGREKIKDAWVHATQGQQEDIQFGYEFLAIADDRGIARWWAGMKARPSKRPVRMEGIFLISLTSDGLCTEFREWWNEDPPATGASEYE